MHLFVLSVIRLAGNENAGTEGEYTGERQTQI